MRQPVALVYSAAKLIIETIRKFYLTEQLRIQVKLFFSTFRPSPLSLLYGLLYVDLFRCLLRAATFLPHLFFGQKN